MRKLLILVLGASILVSGCAGVNRKIGASYKEHLSKGQYYMETDKYDKSVKEFTEALKLGEQMNKARIPTIMLGEAYVKGNEIGKAAKIADEATQKWPRDASAWELAGKVELKQNRLKEAGYSLERALELARSKEDKKRINSLLSLAKGLQSYSRANMQSTKQHFLEIKDMKLAKDVKVKSKSILGVDMGK